MDHNKDIIQKQGAFMDFGMQDQGDKMTDNGVLPQDERLTQVEADRNAALDEVEKTYDNMAGEYDKGHQNRLDENEKWKQEQEKLQQERSDFEIEKIEQQKQQTEKEYVNEQSAAYADWQKQSKKHGVEAEQMATNGMVGSGYSESSQIAMYNSYQYRITAAKASFEQATVSYNNAMTEARLQNNAALAEIAANAYEKKMELIMEAVLYKNTLLANKLSAKQNVESRFDQRWQSVLDEIYREDALAEEKRQFNEQLTEEKRQFDAELALAQKGNSNYIKQDGSKSDQVYPLTDDGENSEQDSGEKPVDMDSVNALGYGPVSAERLAELVESGKIILVDAGDKMVAIRNETGNGGTSAWGGAPPKGGFNINRRASSYLGGI